MTTKLAYEDVLDKFNAGTVSGKYGALYVTLVNPDTGVPYTASGGGGGGSGAATIADGADVTQGAKADAPATDDTGSWTIAAVLKRISGLIASALGTVTPGTAATKSTLTGITYTSSLQTLTTGQQTATQCDVNGNAWVRMKGTSGTGIDAVSNVVAYISGSNSAVGTSAIMPAASYLFNGTAWDRPRGNVNGARVQGAALTNTNRSAAVGTTTQVLAAANANRAGLVLQNVAATGDIWYAFGIPAVVNGLGSFKLVPGATFYMEMNVVDTAAVNVIATAAATNLSALEY